LESKEKTDPSEAETQKREELADGVGRKQPYDIRPQEESKKEKVRARSKYETWSRGNSKRGKGEAGSQQGQEDQNERGENRIHGPSI
jgi:hypothetical protein